MGAGTGNPRMVEGVTYTPSDLAPGLLMFGCDRLKASLSLGGCAKRWSEAKAPAPKGRRRGGEIGDDGASAPDRFAACRGCPVGAQHAGEAHISYSTLFGASICPRCRKGTTRMIGGRVCVSCYNRQREMREGKNARGNAPTKLQALHSVVFLAVVGDRVRVIRADGVADMVEPVIQTLRTTPGKATFAFAGNTMGLRQAALFSSFTPRPPRRPNLRPLQAVSMPRRAVDDRQGLLFG